MYRGICLLILLLGIHCSNNGVGTAGPGIEPADLSMGSADLSTGAADMSMGPADMSMPGSEKICSAGGWCWENPLAQGNNLFGAWGADANNVWAIGQSGTILKGDYDPPIRTYTDPRMEMSCGLPRKLT